MENRVCYKCNREKPLSEISKCTGSTKWKALCKQCRNEYLYIKKRMENPEKFFPVTHKTCPDCKKNLQLCQDNFRIKSDTSNRGRDKQWKYYSSLCKLCERERNRVRQNEIRTPQYHKDMYKKNKKYLRGYEKRRRDIIHPEYVKNIIANKLKIPRSTIPDQLIEINCKQIKTYRICKQLKKEREQQLQKQLVSK